MSKAVKYSIPDQLEYMTNNPNKSKEHYMKKLHISLSTYFRRTRSLKKMPKEKEIDIEKKEEITIDTHDEKITKELVEYWILTEDKRADIGMKFIMFKDKFSTKVEIDDTAEEDEFEHLLNHSNLGESNDRSSDIANDELFED